LTLKSAINETQDIPLVIVECTERDSRQYGEGFHWLGPYCVSPALDELPFYWRQAIGSEIFFFRQVRSLLFFFDARHVFIALT